MLNIWIVHREAAQRVALVRLAAAPAEAVSGAPGDPVFESAGPPGAVLMGLAGDLEAELEFAHRQAPRLPGTGWVLVGDAGRLARARRLFDTLPAHFVAYPPPAAELRSTLRSAAERPAVEPLPLSQRPARDSLAGRFARGFADLELPELLRALDPRLKGVPILILGEPGSGRGILARYIHHFGAGAGGALAELPCTAETTAEELHSALEQAARDPQARHSLTLWLSEVDLLAPAVQRLLQGWLEYGPPAGGQAAALRWIASAGGEGLLPGLRRALAGLTLRTPPLRERPELVANLAQGIARDWCTARAARWRRLGEDALAVLEEYPWPGNLRELEALVEQSLAASDADPLGPADLVLDGEPFAPLDAVSVGTLVELPEPAALAPADEERALVAEDELESVLEQLEETENSAPAFLEPVPPPPPPEGSDAPWPREQPTPTAARAAGSLLRLAASLGHELRNPLTAVRTFAELLPERHSDAEFRDRFGKLTLEGLARIDRVLDRLERLGSLGVPERLPVDVSGMLEDVLRERRGSIRERRLLVLEELDRSRPHAICDPEQLRLALEALLDRSLELVPERGDVYLASRQVDSATGGSPGVRLLLRYRGPQAPAGPTHPDVSLAANSVEFAVADIIIRAQDGSLTIDTDRSETVIVIDLPG